MKKPVYFILCLSFFSISSVAAQEKRTCATEFYPSSQYIPGVMIVIMKAKNEIHLQLFDQIVQASVAQSKETGVAVFDSLNAKNCLEEIVVPSSFITNSDGIAEYNRGEQKGNNLLFLLKFPEDVDIFSLMSGYCSLEYVYAVDQDNISFAPTLPTLIQRTTFASIKEIYRLSDE